MILFCATWMTCAAPGQQPASSPPQGKPLSSRPVADPNDAALQAAAAEAIRINGLARINGVPYDQPSAHDKLIDYLKDTYGWPGQARTTIRALYSQARGKPDAWNQDWGGFGERFASSEGTTIITSNVRYAMELTFHEDLRYLPCLRCSAKKKIENALLAEITARHDSNGRRFFTLSPTVADFSGPIVAHSLWYPGIPDPVAGVVAARTVFATRIGAHLFQEFVLVHYHPQLKPQN